MTLEILCTDLFDFRPKSVGEVSKNVFCKNRPDVGVKSGLICHPRSVCAKFGIDRSNNFEDIGPKV